MMDYGKHMNRRETPQSEPIPGRPDMVQNYAGGYGFAVDDWVRLERFLVLGTEGGTYYVGERELTREMAQAVERCIQQDGMRVVDKVIEISDAGRAPKNDPALFVLALCASIGEEVVRQHALEELPKVARIGTHLFHFARYVKALRGWGRALRHAVAAWYEDMPIERLAEQAIKYKGRDGWTHRDLLRLAHPKTEDPARNAVFRYMVKGYEALEAGGLKASTQKYPRKIEAAELLAFTPTMEKKDGRAAAVSAASILIRNERLPRECVPTELLNSPEVWAALLENMPMTAMIRNLAKMTSVGLLRQLSPAAQIVADRLGDPERLAKARIHPVQVLSALKVYAQGHGERGSLTWEPVPQIIDALDAAFYATFTFLEATNKRFVLGIDVSGSMDFERSLVGLPGLVARDGAAAMAMATLHAEPACAIIGFCGAPQPLPLSKRMRMDDVIEATSDLPFGRTDCAVPMLWALDQGIEADVFVIYTDNETWCGRIHPIQALQRYREKTGIPAKLVVVAMQGTPFTIADPNDAGMLDVVGLDSAFPAVLQDFASGPKS